ncbi:18108_t:CDS:2 [Funneliformis geosporum]|nr:18108_t:CDS:2 [Funneliformis geosporum]
MLETYANKFDMEGVHLKIIEQVHTGCNDLPLNIVILKPGNPLNYNKNVHTAYKMYRDDLLQR